MHSARRLTHTAKRNSDITSSSKRPYPNENPRLLAESSHDVGRHDWIRARQARLVEREPWSTPWRVSSGMRMGSRPAKRKNPRGLAEGPKGVGWTGVTRTQDHNQAKVVARKSGG